MSQNNLINPAKRLQKVLKKVVESKQAHTLMLWGEVFEVEDVFSEQGLISINLNLIALRDLFDEVVMTLENIPNLNEDLFIAPIKQLLNIILASPHSDSHFGYLSNQFGAYRSYLSQKNLTSLDFAEYAISQDGGFNEKQIPENEIQKILDDLETLYSSISVSFLLKNLKESLLELISEMRQCVSEYDVRGASALRRALTKSVGVVVANKEEIEVNKDKPELRDFFLLLNKIDKMTADTKKEKWTLLLNAAANILPTIK